MLLFEQSDTPKEDPARVQPDLQEAESQQTSPPTQEKAGKGDCSSTGGSSSGSHLGSGSESSNENEPNLESTVWPKISSERSTGLPSREDLSVVQRSWVNPEPNSWGLQSNLPLKGDQNINEPASIESVKKEQQLPNKKNLRSLKDFLSDLIYYSWYREDHNNIFKNILNEFGITNNLTRGETINFCG